MAGNKFYCAVVERDQHPLCQGGLYRTGDETEREPPSNNGTLEEEREPPCRMESRDQMYLENRPFVYRYIPYCTSHFRCGWIYILIGGKILIRQTPMV